MKKGPIIAIATFIILTAGIYFLPITQPQATAQEVSVESEEAVTEVDLDQKVKDAVLIIQNAEGAPMQGVTMLKEVLAKDPNHVEANVWLGEFSMMSGQFEKAVPRFEKVLEVEPDNDNAAVKLSEAFAQLNENEKAKNVLNTFIKNNPDNTAVEEIKAILNNIK